jgi:hypothetical protein|tara:strand:+ start:380 stop:562 length:183 start_codon:yes stop_codon:yes gene_type:complete
MVSCNEITSSEGISNAEKIEEVIRAGRRLSRRAGESSGYVEQYLANLRRGRFYAIEGGRE